MGTLFRLTIIILLFVSPAIADTVKDVSGHWEGSIQVHGRDFPPIVDLDSSHGTGGSGCVLRSSPGVEGGR